MKSTLFKVAPGAFWKINLQEVKNFRGLFLFLEYRHSLHFFVKRVDFFYKYLVKVKNNFRPSRRFDKT